MVKLGVDEPQPATPGPGVPQEPAPEPTPTPLEPGVAPTPPEPAPPATPDVPPGQTPTTPTGAVKPGSARPTEPSHLQQPVPLKKYLEMKSKKTDAEGRYDKLQTEHGQLLEWANQYRPYIEQAQRYGPQNQPSQFQQQMGRWEQRMAQLEKSIDENRTSMIQTDIESQLRVLNQRYPHMRRDEVLLGYERNPEIPLEDLARVSHEEIESIRNSAVQGYVKEKTQKGPSPPLGRGGSAPTPPARKKFESLDEAGSAAREHLNHILAGN